MQANMGRKDRVKKKKKDPLFKVIAKEILSKRIEEKSDIVSCRGVCKQWRRFLSSPTFIRMHRNNHPETIDDCKLLVIDPPNSFSFRTFSLNQTIPPHFPNPNPNPNPDSVPNISLIASSDGLVCVAFSRRRNTTLVVVNPLTGAFKNLPPIHALSAADPIGFYVDSINMDYKLVCLVANGLKGAFVYSRRLDLWEKIEFSVLPYDYLRHSRWSPPIIFGQSLYFQVTGCSDRRFSRTICFDVKTDKFSEIPIKSRFKNGVPNDYSAGLVVLLPGLHMYVSYYIHGVNGVLRRWVGVWWMDDDEWMEVGGFSVERKEPQLIRTQTIGKWLAVLDHHENSFIKITPVEFKARYGCFTSAPREYGYNRVIYVQTLLTP